MKFTPADATSMFLALGLLLLGSRFLGEIARRLNQPSVLGELLVGIMLGPTLLGRFGPEIYHAVFPVGGAFAVFLSGFTQFSVALFLFVAGLEIDFSSVVRLGRSALTVSAAGIIIPFALGALLGQAFPERLGFQDGTVSPLIFALFFGTALSISALPVIAKTLMDLNLYRTRVGSVTMAAAVVDDLFGWTIFALILTALSPGSGHFSVGTVLGLTLLFTILALTLGRGAINRLLPIFARHTSWPGGVISLVLVLGLFGAAFTEWIGIHALFGAFVVGVAIGDSEHMKEVKMNRDVKKTIEQFITSILAPIVFATAGLRVDFWTHFDLLLTLTVIVIACAGKILGCWWAAKSTGMDSRESLAIGFALNSRGAMEIIMALTALELGIIGLPLFVALVTMAIVTSAISGPSMKWALKNSQVLSEK
jgi:Kef-type K+ transport system membrane component KefB